MPSVAEYNRVGEKVHALVRACRKVMDSYTKESLALAVNEMKTLVEHIDYRQKMSNAAIVDTTYYQKDGTLQDWLYKEEES